MTLKQTWDSVSVNNRGVTVIPKKRTNMPMLLAIPSNFSENFNSKSKIND